MRLLMTAWSFYPAQEGGPSNALYWLASGLARAGFEMRVVTTDRYLQEGSVPVDKWTELNGFKVFYQSKTSDKTVLNKELEKCDMLLTDGICRLEYFRLVLRALKKKKKVILSPRGELFESAIDHKGRLYGNIKRAYIRMMRISLRNKVMFHATSIAELDAVRKYFGIMAPSFIIPNYMILPESVSDSKEKRPKYLLYVGRINHIKNLDILLEGLALSDKFKNSEYVLKLAGQIGGTYYDYLLSKVLELGLSGKVEFLGLVTGKEKNLLYANAKCLFLLSKSENFGNVVVEALAQGTPVIASKGTPWQALSETGAGSWIDAEPSEVCAIVDGMLDMDDDDYSKVREAALRLSKKFDIYSNIDKWTHIIEGC